MKKKKGNGFFSNILYQYNKKFIIKGIYKESGKIDLFYKTSDQKKKNKIENEINLAICLLLKKIHNTKNTNINYQKYINNFITIINKINNNNFELFKTSIKNSRYNKNDIINIFTISCEKNHYINNLISEKYYYLLSEIYTQFIIEISIFKWPEFQTKYISNKYNFNTYKNIIYHIIHTFKVNNISINIINVILFIKLFPKTWNIDINTIIQTHMPSFIRINDELNNSNYKNIYKYHTQKVPISPLSSSNINPHPLPKPNSHGSMSHHSNITPIINSHPLPKPNSHGSMSHHSNITPIINSHPLPKSNSHGSMSHHSNITPVINPHPLSKSKSHGSMSHHSNITPVINPHPLSKSKSHRSMSHHSNITPVINPHPLSKSKSHRSMSHHSNITPVITPHPLPKHNSVNPVLQKSDITPVINALSLPNPRRHGSMSHHSDFASSSKSMTDSEMEKWYQKELLKEKKGSQVAKSIAKVHSKSSHNSDFASSSKSMTDSEIEKWYQNELLKEKKGSQVAKSIAKVHSKSSPNSDSLRSSQSMTESEIEKWYQKELLKEKKGSQPAQSIAKVSKMSPVIDEPKIPLLPTPLPPDKSVEYDSPIWAADDDIINVNKLHLDRKSKYLEFNKILNKQIASLSLRNIVYIPPLEISTKISMPKTFDYIDILNKFNIIKNINSVYFTLSNNADNILFYESFGTASAYGSNYKTLIYNDNTSVTCSTKFVTCDTKLTGNGNINPNSNVKEILLLNLVSKFALFNINPNLPIMYKSFKLDIRNSSQIINTIYPKFDTKKCDSSHRPSLNAEAYCYMNEIFSGDARKFIINFSHKPDLIINAISNIIISILTFWSITNRTHNDCHMGNFLYKKLKYDIKTNEYYKYNIYGTNIYIENLGFLWTSWDYGLAIHNFAENIKTKGTNDIIRAISIFIYHLQDTDNNILCNLYYIYNNIKINYKYIHLFASIIYNIKNNKKNLDKTLYNKFITCIFDNRYNKQQKIFPIFDDFIMKNTLDITKMNLFQKLIYDVIKQYCDNIVSKKEGGQGQMIKRVKKIRKGKDHHACANISTDPSNLAAFPSNFTIIYNLYNNFFESINLIYSKKKIESLFDPTNKDITYEYVKNLYFDINRANLPAFDNFKDDFIFEYYYNLECNKQGKTLYDIIISNKIWYPKMLVNTDKNLFWRRDEIINVLAQMLKSYTNIPNQINKQNGCDYNYDFSHELSFLTFDFFNKFRDNIEIGNKFFYNSENLPPNAKIINKTSYYIGNGNIGYKWKKIQDKSVIKHYTINGYNIIEYFKNKSIIDLFKNEDEITLNEIDIKNHNIDDIQSKIYKPIGKFSLLYIINSNSEFYIIDNSMKRLLSDKKKIK